MASDYEDLLAAARAIRPYLSQLTPDRANDFDREIVALLTAASNGGDVSLKLTRLLRSQPATREWVHGFLTLRRPPDVEKAFEPVPGEGVPIAALKFVCPEGDYVRYVASVGERIEPCPSHHVSLVEA